MMTAHTCFEDENDVKQSLKKFSLFAFTLEVCCSKKSTGFTSFVSCVCDWSKNNFKTHSTY